MRILCLFLALLLTGCGKTELAQLDLSAMDKIATAQKACYDSRKLDLTGVPNEAKGYAVMAHQNSSLILAVLGKDPCATTNAFDVQIAEVKSKNEVLGSVTSSLTNFGFAWLGADVLNTALKEAGNTYRASEFGDVVVTNEIDSRNTSTLNEDSYNTHEENQTATTTAPVE